MITVLAIDALEYSLVERFNCTNLKQKFYGKTDISEFSEPRTMVLWPSFMTGMNMEKEVMSRGTEDMWNFTLDISDTFFSIFEKTMVIDLPGFSYDVDQHKLERNMLKKFFESNSDEEKEEVRRAYNEKAFSHHREIKNQYLRALEGDFDFVLGYFSAADVIGHLSFGNTTLMRSIYRDLDDLAGQTKGPLIVLSDHGMVNIGPFGDHSSYGFWSSNFEDLGHPAITDFPQFIINARELGPN